MSELMFRRMICGLFAVTGVACTPTAHRQSVIATDNTNPAQVNSQVTLPPALAESSGLACLSDDEFLTVNDSGNAATVYRFDASGKITTQTKVPAANNDWEALSIHQQQLVIADTGNNTGLRSEISLLLMPLQDGKLEPAKLRTFKFSYKNSAAEVKPYHHNLDAEAIASDGEYLWMFSKNWLADSSSVYKINVNESVTELEAHSAISPIPGVITDAAFAADERIFVLVGYRNVAREALSFMFTRDYQPFILLANQHFQILKHHDLAGAGQVEAVCLHKGRIWLSQENSGVAAARFWSVGTIRELLEP